MSDAPLPSGLRDLLAGAIRQARRESETGARKALRSLAVDRAGPFESMSPADRTFRGRLRRRGRQVGDRLDRRTGAREIDRLVREVACEHWHRMLFARYLAENGLLRDPDYGADLSLDDCRELADDEGIDRWAFAGRCAERMLPEIFGRDDPVLALSLPPETRQELERLLGELPKAVFSAPDSLGWTYQFWQAERKTEVNRAGAKIGADELPAVTQLFTERYMVLFLLHNTIGAWRAGRILAARPDLAEAAADEAELRRHVRLDAGGGYDFSHLRFVRGAGEEDGDDEPTGPWRPAAGSFPEWPREASALRVLDPCCGSGHFLAEAFGLLVRLRMAEEGVPVEEAVRRVLRDNLFGLELDPRCTQIAAFNLALAAWRLAGEPVALPPLNIACTGLAPNASEAEWREPADRAASGADVSARERARIREGMAGLHELFARAPELGSLLNPRSAESDLFRAGFKSLRESLAAAIGRERGRAGRDERAVAAAGMARAAEILQGRYTLVVTNVPFLARGKQAGGLREFAETHHGDAKGDIATVFVSRIFEWLGEGGTQAVVSPQNWLFLTTYRKLRERLLKRRTWNLVARLGPGAFETITGHVVNVALNVLSAGHPDSGRTMAGVDVSAPRGRRPIRAAEKARLLRGSAVIHTVRQAEQLKNPDARLMLSESTGTALLSEYTDAVHGFGSKDSPRFFKRFWEIKRFADDWQFLQTTLNSTQYWLGCEQVVYWQRGRGVLAERGRIGLAVPAGRIAWGKVGVAVSQMGALPCALYTGEIFDKNVAVISPKRGEYLPAVWCFCSSPEYAAAVREIDHALKVTNATLVKVPFDLDRWKRLAADRYPNGLPEPYSNDPTQWIFHGHPVGSVIWDEDAKRTAHGPLRTDPTVLQIAVTRLLGYRWPAELDPEMRLASEQRAWVERSGKLDGFADEDGIVCLSAARGELGAADRLRELLAAAYGEAWSASTERALLSAAAATTKRKPSAAFDAWLRDRFFQEHCTLFHNRPFIWHIWDGRKDGFHALVNYHRLAGPDGEGRRTLESLTFAYLNEWIERQRADRRDGTPGADARLAAALDLQQQLRRILAGEPPCDIFVRWRPLHGQAIGWEPDISDGVRLNIRPFMRAELGRGGRAGAGLLRMKPNITWKKDRGKEPEEPRAREDFPWFRGCPGGGSETQRTDFRAAPDASFDGNRWNDLHYTRAAKEAARQRVSNPERSP